MLLWSSTGGMHPGCCSFRRIDPPPIDPMPFRRLYAPGNRWDWVGLYAATEDSPVEDSRAPLAFRHTGRQGSRVDSFVCLARPGSATIEGEASLPTSDLSPGLYEVVFCVDDSYVCTARCPFMIGLSLPK